MQLEETYQYLAAALGSMKLAYLHIVDHSSMGSPEVAQSVKSKIGVPSEALLSLAAQIRMRFCCILVCIGVQMVMEKKN